MEQVASTYGEERSQVQSVLLLTDGLANHGITNKPGILEQMKKMQNEGLNLHTLSSKHTPRKAPPASASSGSGFFNFLFSWGKKPSTTMDQNSQQKEEQEEQGASASTVDKSNSSSKKVICLYFMYLCNYLWKLTADFGIDLLRTTI